MGRDVIVRTIDAAFLRQAHEKRLGPTIRKLVCQGAPGASNLSVGSDVGVKYDGHPALGPGDSMKVG